MGVGTLQAQTIKKYDGPMNIPPELHQLYSFCPRSTNKTIGSYTYYENADEERIKHGDFKIVFCSPNFNREVRGKYQDGKKTGVWTVKDILIAVKTNYAKHLELTFNFKNDFLDGPLTGIIHNGLQKYTVKCSFSNGRIIGPYHLTFEDSCYEDVSYDVDGVFDENGLPSGIWTFKQKGGVEITQKRLYMNGAVVYIQEYDASSGVKRLPFCAFSKVTKAPAASEITSEIIDGKDCIKYQDLVACRDSIELTSHGYYPNKKIMGRCRQSTVGEFWITELLELFPESMWRYARCFRDDYADIWDGPEPLVDQRYSWSGFYTDREW